MYQLLRTLELVIYRAVTVKNVRESTEHHDLQNGYSDGYISFSPSMQMPL